MKVSLKQAVQHKAGSRRLEDDQLAALQSLQEQQLWRQTRHRRKYLYALAGAAATLLVVLGLLVRQSGPPPHSGDMIAAIADEVVKNHLHLKPLDIQTGDMENIRSYFKKLDFQPVESRYLESIGLQLTGGRYCSLQGITAAQLRFKDLGSDGVHTLYQVGYDPSVFKVLPDFDRGEQPVSIYVKGIRVTIWVEKDLLLALTEN